MSAPRRPGALLAVLLLLLLTCAAAAGCARDAEPRRITLLGPWTGTEEESFVRRLGEFTGETGIHVDYQGTTATREVLLTGVESGDTPDIAVLPGIGDLADYARNDALTGLGSGLVDEKAYDGPWLAVPRGMTGRFWVPVKADLKSLVWHERGDDPARLAGDVAHWCVGMGSDTTTGWPGTDWIEDLLLQRSGADAYDAWATGRTAWTAPEVVDAWRVWGEFMAQHGGAVARASLTTDYRGEEGGEGLLFARNPDCSLEHQGSFARGLYGDAGARAEFVPSPGVLPRTEEGPSRDREVTGDFAAVFRESDEALALVRYLADEDTQRAWARDRKIPAFSANSGVTEKAYEDPVGRAVIREMRTADRLCLDASDAMPPELRRVFHAKVLEFLTDPGQDVVPLLTEIERVRKEGLPPRTQWLEHVCG